MTNVFLEKQVEGGDIDIKAYIKVGNDWVQMPKFGMKLCSVTDCPIEKGKQNIDKTFTVPGVVPKVFII